LQASAITQEPNLFSDTHLFQIKASRKAFRKACTCNNADVIFASEQHLLVATKSRLLRNLHPAMMWTVTCGQCLIWPQTTNWREYTIFCLVSHHHLKHHCIACPGTQKRQRFAVNCLPYRKPANSKCEQFCCGTTRGCCAGTSLLSPLFKSLLTQREPAALKHRGRAAVMHRIEQRMRFLAVSSDFFGQVQLLAVLAVGISQLLHHRQIQLPPCVDSTPVTGSCCYASVTSWRSSVPAPSSQRSAICNHLTHVLPIGLIKSTK